MKNGKYIQYSRIFQTFAWGKTLAESPCPIMRCCLNSLVTIRKLKESGVECYFEKEGIYTIDGKGELLITIMSSLAQEESRSISENITWGQRKSFSDGKVHA